MPRHYSKVFVELPDHDGDPPVAQVTIDCDVCGEVEVQVPMPHLGTVLRALQQTLEE